ncbi:MAG: DUF4279 domain-containing protein [Candidatus Omnitrophica bacterium]|nr:DUF4279 domain-containing protein [Candidatus Omnitrophota bacterium]
MGKRRAIGYREHFASLRIFGKIPSFEIITKRLGVRPDHVHRKGERRSELSKPYEHDSWQVKALVARNRSLEHHVRWLHRRLAKKTPYLKRLAQTHEVDLYCSYHSNYDQGRLEFPPEVLAWCGNLGIPLRVSILVQE